MPGRRPSKKTSKTKKTRREETPASSGPDERGVQIQSPPDRLLGIYTNGAIIQHTKHEFVLDFLSTLPSMNTLAARLIATPANAKRIHRALGANLDKYQKRFGEIDADDE